MHPKFSLKSHFLRLYLLYFMENINKTIKFVLNSYIGLYKRILKRGEVHGGNMGVIAVVQNIPLGICSRPPNRGQNGSHGVNL